MSLIDNKQSILIQNQFPDFVKEDYPTFIRFMEAYYEFLENKLENQKNDLNYQARKYYTISDIDENLSEFEEYFFKTFLELFPRDTLASKSLLIKNSIPLYLSKGNERAIKYFFRALFDEEINIQIPRNDVLVASGGNWKITKVLRSFPQVYATYIAGNSTFNGVASNTNFYLPQEVSFGDVTVTVDGQSQTSEFWQLENAVYSGKSFKTPYLIPRQIYFRPNGLEMFILDDQNNTLNKHTLSDDWNIQSTSATASQSINLTTLINDYGVGSRGQFAGLEFKPDGSSFYHADYTSTDGRIWQYDMTEVWNLQTAYVSANTNISFLLASTGSPSPNVSALRDVKFDSSGTKMYVLNGVLANTYQFSLSTPWNIATATYPTEKVFRYGSTSAPVGLNFRNDDITYYVSVKLNNEIRKYNMSVAGDISTSSLESTFIPNIENEIDAFILNVKPEGDVLYYGGTTTDKIFQYGIGPDYYIQKEYKKLVFPKPLSNGSIVKVDFDNFDPNILINRKLTGNASGASAIVEAVLAYNNENSDIFEYEIDEKTIIDNFINGEDFKTDVLSKNDDIINLFLPGYSGLQKIRIVDEGTSYNVGDPVILIGGDFIQSACVAVSKVFAGVLNQLTIDYGGAGFVSGFPIIVGNISPYSVTAAIVDVDKSGANTPNTYVFNTDMILDSVNVNIGTAAANSLNFRLSSLFSNNTTISSPNVNTRLIDTFSYSTISDIGSITEAIVLTSTASTNVLSVYNINAISSNTRFANGRGIVTSTFSIDFMGSIGRVEIINKGSGYKVGDKLNFTNVPGGLGIGCRAAVSSVDSSGGITLIQFQPAPPTSNCLDVSVIAGSNVVIGNNSTFLIDGFANGRDIIIFNQKRTIDSINGLVSNTEIRTSQPFTITKSNTEIGLYNSYPIGGQGYQSNYFPIVTIETQTGTGAEIIVTSIMGDGESLKLGSDKKPGGIEEVVIYDKGIGYKVAPVVIMTGSGDGNAILEADINNSYYEYEGKYLDNSSHLSSTKKLQDSRLFNTGSYILKTKQQFSKYKESFLKLLHPSGTAIFSEYTPDEDIIFNENIAQNDLISDIEITTSS